MNGIIGQSRALRILARLMAGDRLPHALLFVGPEGAGAVAAAVAFARALHCQAGGVEPCGICGGCRKTGALNHPDLTLVFPAKANAKEEVIRAALLEVVSTPYQYALPEDSTAISIEHIRTLQRQFAYGTFQGQWRTAVILHADHMRAQAANALLKTLEEPPPRSLMILTAPATESLLPTIVSRCQILKFPLLSPQVVCDALLERGVAAQVGAVIGRMCGGNFRRAMGMVGGDVGGAMDRAFRFLESLVWGEDVRTFAAIENLSGERQEALNVLKGAEAWLRDAVLYRCGHMDGMTQVERESDVRRLSEAFDHEQVFEIAKKIEVIREMNVRNVNIHLGLISLWRLVRERQKRPRTMGHTEGT